MKYPYTIWAALEAIAGCVVVTWLVYDTFSMMGLCIVVVTALAAGCLVIYGLTLDCDDDG